MTKTAMHFRLCMSRHTCFPTFLNMTWNRVTKNDTKTTNEKQQNLKRKNGHNFNCIDLFLETRCQY